MTKQQAIQRFPTYITIANMIILLSLAYQAGAVQKSIEGKVEENKMHIDMVDGKIDRHQNTTYMHRPMDDLMIQFVPRAELQSKLDAIIDSQREIKQLMNDKHKP